MRCFWPFPVLKFNQTFGDGVKVVCFCAKPATLETMNGGNPTGLVELVQLPRLFISTFADNALLFLV